MSATEVSPSQITLFRGWDERGKHVWSPYVIKVEARLRFAGTKYGTAVGSPKTAPKGKIPYVECRGLSVRPGDGAGEFTPKETATDPEKFGDSTIIIERLCESGIIPDINSHLSPSARAHDAGLRALLEDKLYFYHTSERWVQNYYTMRDHVLWSIPYPIRVVVGLIIYRNTTATLHGQGTGRFSAQEIASSRLKIWQSFNDLLVESKSKQASAADSSDPFWVLGGDGPSEADGVLFGFIVSVLICTAAPDSQKVVRGLPVLVDYASRIHDRYFPDYEKWL